MLHLLEPSWGWASQRTAKLIPGIADQIFPQLVKGAVPEADRGEGRLSSPAACPGHGT